MQNTSPGAIEGVSQLLSATDDVKGTKVYSPSGDHLGNIDDLMIDPESGRVSYGVLQFGGLFGIGSDHQLVPFGKLRYDHELHGYITDLTKEQLEGAPAWNDGWRSDREWQARSYKYYGLDPWWPVA